MLVSALHLVVSSESHIHASSALSSEDTLVFKEAMSGCPVPRYLM